MGFWPVAMGLTALPLTGVNGAEDMRYGVASWPQKLGNHRARIRVADKAEAVRVHIPWRRPDANPDKKHILILHATGDKPVKNLARIRIDRESGDLVFQPEHGPGEYHVYYLPYTVSGWRPMPKVTYPPVRSTAEGAWLQRHGLTAAQLPDGKWRSLPSAAVLDIQARSEFDRFDPMAIIATADEVKQLLAAHRGRPYLLFGEDRRHPIRLRDDLPLRWIRRGPTTAFDGEAQRGEFYAFQIGVYAATKPIRDLAVSFDDLRPREQGTRIPASAFTCFNLGGTDAHGRPMKQAFSVEQGKVGALWLGVQIPEDAVPGQYEGTFILQPRGTEGTQVRLTLSVSPDLLKDAGDAEPWRHSRLRWLNSTLGMDDEVVAPYTPMVIEGQTVRCLGRDLTFSACGLPASIRSGETEILADPVTLVAETPDASPIRFNGATTIVKRTAGSVIWESKASTAPFALQCRATMAFDGYVNYEVSLEAQRPTKVRDIRLQIPLRRDVARYIMGMGRKGGLRPTEWKWTWDRNRHQDSVWVGSVEAGLQCKLKPADYHWPLVNVHFKRQGLNLPDAWHNGGKGGCTVTEVGGDRVVIRAYSGPRDLKAGQALRFDFALLITPVKPLDPDHWNQRYYHATIPPDKAAKAGAKIINIHHANAINPYINYPFLRPDKLAAYVKRAHDTGMKAKIYYTLRELSNHIVEMWAVRALGDRVFADGPGGGYAWLQEHLIKGYVPAWHHWFGDGDVDAALVTEGASRWHNYYVEGLRWLLRNVEIDGLYLDDVGYDRRIMQRVRKVLDRERPGCLIDLHSWNHFNERAGWANCANLYMEHMPYLNSIWFGEGFNYDESPDYWLVEISGIPFGLFGEMLQGGGNPWRGMIYGMTCRYYGKANPGAIWRRWDAFGIQDATMIGYWDPTCPVSTDCKDVLATVYRREGKSLVSLASWAKTRVDCRLTIDWEALGLRADKASLFAPEIPKFQPTASFKPSDAIPVSPARGWLLIVDEQTHKPPAGTDDR